MLKIDFAGPDDELKLFFSVDRLTNLLPVPFIFEVASPAKINHVKNITNNLKLTFSIITSLVIAFSPSLSRSPKVNCRLINDFAFPSYLF